MTTPDKRGSRLPARIAARLRAPLIVAPMLRVSGPELVIAACKAGAIGAFPAANARTPEALATWLFFGAQLAFEESAEKTLHGTATHKRQTRSTNATHAKLVALPPLCTNLAAFNRDALLRE